MKPNRRIDYQNVGELTRQLVDRKTTANRFSIDIPVKDMANAIYASCKAEAESRGYRPFDFDQETEQHIMAVAKWLCDPQGKPGLMLTGLYGNGKTTLMLAICNLINFLFESDNSLHRLSIKFVESREIARIGSREESRQEFMKYVSADMLAIDEVGEEPAEIISFGRVYTPVRDLLVERYKRQKLTIIATNLVNTKENPQLTEHYGARVVDRLREMMKIVTFKNPSYRKPDQK